MTKRRFCLFPFCRSHRFSLKIWKGLHSDLAMQCMLLKTWKWLLGEHSNFVLCEEQPHVHLITRPIFTFSLLLHSVVDLAGFQHSWRCQFLLGPLFNHCMPLISAITQSNWIQWDLGSWPVFLLSSASFKGVSAFVFWNHGHLGKWSVHACSFWITGHIIIAFPTPPHPKALYFEI